MENENVVITTEETKAEETKRVKPRTHKMVDNPADNVKGMATYRLNKVIETLRVFGLCCGSQFAWTDEQMEKADMAILKAAELAMTSIKEGKAIRDAGIQL